MSIEALYPSRRYLQRGNPLLERAQRRDWLILVAALAFCLVSVGIFRIFPNEASAAGRNESAPPFAHTVSESGKHIRIIPLYHIPPEQAGGLAYQD